MKIRSILLASMALAATVLAGCSDAPPSGDFSGSTHAVDLSGDATFAYQEEERNAPDQTPNPLYDALCNPNSGPGECKDAKTTVTVMLHTAPDPNANGYTAVLVGGTDPAELAIGPLTVDDTGMYTVEADYPADYDGQFSAIEIRMGDFVVATGPTAEGKQTLAVADTVGGVTATASYSGKKLDVEVTGLQQNASYVAWLVGVPDGAEDGAELEHLEPSFPVTEGANSFTAPRNINEYAEFHIHVSGSKVNVLKTTIE